MAVNSYLDSIASKLITKDEQASNIDKSLAYFIERMKDYFAVNETVRLIDIKVFGSYARDTNLPQNFDENTDVDIMLVMEWDNSTPQTYLNRVRRAVEAKYFSSDISQSSPTVVLKMQHIRFEITPAVYVNGNYYIKSNDDNWIITECTKDLNYITCSNKENYYKIKPVIRLVKYWNVSFNNKSFSSYQIEKIIVSYYSFCRYQFYDTKLYLLSSFQQVRSLVEYDYQKKLLDKAISYTSSAIDQDSINPSYAVDIIRCIIPE